MGEYLALRAHFASDPQAFARTAKPAVAPSAPTTPSVAVDASLAEAFARQHAITLAQGSLHAEHAAGFWLRSQSKPADVEAVRVLIAGARAFVAEYRRKA